MAKALDLSDFTKEEIKGILNEIRHPVDVAVCGLGNHFNIAGIIRLCHNFLVNNIYIVDPEDSKDPFYEKGCMGTKKYENIHVTTSKEFEEYISSNNRNLVCCEKRFGLESKNLTTYIYPENPVLMFGSEKFGVPDLFLNHSRADIVGITLYGLCHDLNVAHAAAIIVNDFIVKHYSKTGTK